MPPLRCFALRRCQGLDNLGLAILAKGLPLLESLDLSRCHTKVTDNGVAHLAALSRLTSLVLGNCDRITDQVG